MGHATSVQKAERLNHARQVLAKAETIPDAVARLMRDCGLSRRQAYRYVHLARDLTAPVPVPDRKVPITVKVSQRVVRALHAHAGATGLSRSEIVSRALVGILPRRSRRG